MSFSMAPREPGLNGPLWINRVWSLHSCLFPDLSFWPLSPLIFYILCISKSPRDCHRIYHILGSAASPIPSLVLAVQLCSSSTLLPEPTGMFAQSLVPYFPSSQSPEAPVWVSYRRCLSCGWAGFCNSFLHKPYLRPVDFNGAIHVSGGCKFGPLGSKVSGA